MKVIVTGTVGLDKQPYLEEVRQRAYDDHRGLEIFHVGEMMYAEAPDVADGRILDVSLARLQSLRRSVFKDVLSQAEKSENIIINTHATFRWRHGLFPAFDFDLLAKLDADMYICLIDNVDTLHARLERDHQINHSLKDLLVWREEETLATELMMKGCSLKRSVKKKPARFFLQARGHKLSTSEMVYRMIFTPEVPKAYISFPMTHVADMPEILKEIDVFRHEIADHLVVFDPADLEEQQLYADALKASENGQRVMEIEVLNQILRFDIAELLSVGSDFHAQIYARDFMLIDQADMIISYIPQMPNGKPGLSSGVERELQHAHEGGKDVYIIWRPDTEPSPFVTETATKVVKSSQELIGYFEERGFINKQQGGKQASLF